MKNLIILGALLSVLVGCSTIKEGVADYKLGKETALAEGESSPKDEAKQISNFVGSLPLPFAGQAAPVIGGVLTALFTLQRGRRIRKGIPASPNPATGFLGQASGLEALVQNLSSIVTGAFEVGGDNLPLKRAWKVALATVLALAGFAVTVPAVQAFILSNPGITAGIVGLSALFGGLEKQLSTVKPVVEPKGAGTNT